MWLDNAKHTVLLIGTKNNGEMLRERKYEKPGHRLSVVSGLHRKIRHSTRLVQAVERLEPPWRKRRLTFELNECDPSETTQAIDRPDVKEALCL